MVLMNPHTHTHVITQGQETTQISHKCILLLSLCLFQAETGRSASQSVLQSVFNALLCTVDTKTVLKKGIVFYTLCDFHFFFYTPG